MNTAVLAQLGLSQNEIKVYFALLELEQSTATPIVKKSGVSNSKVYAVLEKLLKKGLVSFVIKNNVKYFQTSDPRNLIELLNDKQKQILLQKEEIEKILPEIERKRRLTKDKPEATIYEGLEGIKAAFNRILTVLSRKEEYFVFTLSEELDKDELFYFFRDYHKKRIEKDIRVNAIVPQRVKPIFLKYHKYGKMNVKFSAQKLPVGVFIFADYVMTLIWEDEPTAFVIKSHNHATKYKDFFKEAWKKAIR